MNMRWLKKLVNKFTINHPKTEKPIVWYKDMALMIGVALIALSFVLGSYGKFIIITKIFKPVEVITGGAVWLLSWIVLFIGISLTGWETFRIIKYRIKHKVKKTYRQAKRLHRRSGEYAKDFHNKNLEKIAKLSKKEYDSINIK